MKHIKKYYESKKLYTEIKHSEWSDILEKCSFLDYNSYEINKLKELEGKKVDNKLFKLRNIRINEFIDYYYDVDINKYGLSIFFHTGNKEDTYPIENRLFHCLKTDDYWYMVDIISISNYRYSFFKCDSFEGVQQILNDLLIK